MENLLKNKKGITLIALVITIIVLLILAGVTIAQITGNESAMDKAIEAKEKNDLGAEFDAIKLATASSIAEGELDLNVDVDTLKKGLEGVVEEEGRLRITKENSPWIVTGKTGMKYKIDQNGMVTSAEPVASVEFENVEDSIGVGKSKKLAIICKGASGNVTEANEVIFDSNNKNIATVEDDGSIKIVNDESKIGQTAEISVIADGIEGINNCEITVVEAPIPKVGDFVEYDAGNWTTDEIGNILIHYTDGTTDAVANSATKPSSNFKFGGFTTTSGKNGNATAYDASNYNYVKEKKIENETIITTEITGWRIFDIADNGTITLISAGCPEDYYHNVATNNRYKSVYILTGDDTNIPETENVSQLRVRDWTEDYGNSSVNITASVLTKTKLDEWFKKYITNGRTIDSSNQSEFPRIYNTKYESLIDNYVHYWIASFNSYGMFKSEPEYKRISNTNWKQSNKAHGVRVLIYLPSSIKLEDNPAGTKTITSRNKDYIYNVWNIQ